jgi:hypothetical protein
LVAAVPGRHGLNVTPSRKKGIMDDRRIRVHPRRRRNPTLARATLLFALAVFTILWLLFAPGPGAGMF